MLHSSQAQSESFALLSNRQLQFTKKHELPYLARISHLLFKVIPCITVFINQTFVIVFCLLAFRFGLGGKLYYNNTVATHTFSNYLVHSSILERNC